MHPFLVVLLALCGFASAIFKRDVQDTVPLAFSAELSGDRDFYEGTTVIYDRSISNENGIYFDTSGQMACIDNDVYVILWSLARAAYTTNSYSRAIGELRLGGQPIFQKGPKTSYYGTTSVTGPSEFASIVQCTTSPPSAVTVGITAWSQSDPVTRLKAPYSSFSGFKLAGEGDDAVYFSAYTSEDFSAFPGTKIQYDSTVYNVGNSYYRGYGAFVCPDDGLYVFTVTSDAPYLISTRWSNSQLMMNGNMLTEGPMTFRTGATGAPDSGTASMTTVVQCQEGLDVYVESKKAHTYDYNTFGAERSTFTGWFLE